MPRGSGGEFALGHGWGIDQLTFSSESGEEGKWHYRLI